MAIDKEGIVSHLSPPHTPLYPTGRYGVPDRIWRFCGANFIFCDFVRMPKKKGFYLNKKYSPVMIPAPIKIAKMMRHAETGAEPPTLPVCPFTANW